MVSTLLHSYVFVWSAAIGLVLVAARLHRVRVLRRAAPRLDRPDERAPAIAAAMLAGRLRPDEAAFAATAYDLVLRGRFRTVPGATGDVVDIGVLPGDASVEVATWEHPVEELLLAACADGPATLGQLDAALQGRSGDSANAFRAFELRFEREMTTAKLLDHEATLNAAALLVTVPLVLLVLPWVDPTIPMLTAGLMVGLSSFPAPNWLPVPMTWPSGRVEDVRAWEGYRRALGLLRLAEAQPAALPIEGRGLVDAVAFGIADGATRALSDALGKVTAAHAPSTGERAHITSRVAHRAAARTRRGLKRRKIKLINPAGASVQEAIAAALLSAWVGVLVLGIEGIDERGVTLAVIAAVLLTITSPFWIALTRPLRRRVTRRGLAREFARHRGATRFVRRVGYVELWRDRERVARAHGALVVEVRAVHRTSPFMAEVHADWSDIRVKFVDGSRWIGSTAGHVKGDTKVIDGEGVVWFDVGLPSGERAAA